VSNNRDVVENDVFYSFCAKWLMVCSSAKIYEVLSENSQTVIVVIASVKEDERGGQGHTSESLLHQPAT
jgi:hypothetical protein